jgi:glucose/arabinose dehydrogenase
MGRGGGRLWLRILGIVAVGSLMASPPVPAAAAVTITATQVVGGLNGPVAFTFGPGGKIWYVEKSTGQIRIYNLATHTNRVFYDVPGVNADGERGMLGIALHPNFPTQPYVYVYATRSVAGHMRNQVLRITDSGGTGTNRTVLLSGAASASSPYHNGGRILFGPDGLLYVVMGDAHNAANAQDLSNNLRGKILRITPSGRIPATNPFPKSRIFAYGIRNSFGFAFDPLTHRLWETENGPECNDELNLIRRGHNYAWGPHETCSGQSPQDTNRDGPNRVLPKRWYTPTIAPTGIAFCQRCGLGTGYGGKLFFGAYNTHDIRAVTLNGTRTGVKAQAVVYSHSSGVLSMEVGPGRVLYFSDFGAIYKLVKA